MPRVITVAKARKAQGQCGKCSAKIKKGDPYRWWKFNFGSRHVRCMSPACAPKASDLTRSEFYSRLYEIEEIVSSALDAFREGGDASDAASALTDAAEQLRELGSECQEKHDNMPEGLQQGDTGQLLEERAGECDGKADELENAASELESFEVYDSVEDFIAEEGEIKRNEGESDEDYQARKQKALEEHNESARDEAASNAEVDLSIS